MFALTQIVFKKNHFKGKCTYEMPSYRLTGNSVFAIIKNKQNKKNTRSHLGKLTAIKLRKEAARPNKVKKLENMLYYKNKV